jgi:hypothetical protein
VVSFKKVFRFQSNESGTLELSNILFLRCGSGIIACTASMEFNISSDNVTLIVSMFSLTEVNLLHQ